MEEVEIHMRATGPDLYCPDCHRLLVHIHESGQWDLAAKAYIEWQIEAFDTTMPPEEVEALPREALCLRRRCRFRRWWRQAHKPFVVVLGLWLVILITTVLLNAAEYGWWLITPFVVVWLNGVAVTLVVWRLLRG